MSPSHRPGFHSNFTEILHFIQSVMQVCCSSVEDRQDQEPSHGKDSICVAQAMGPFAGAAGDVFGMPVIALDSP